MDGLTLGFSLGFLVALQLGPMSLFLIRSTVRSGLMVGLGIGGGIALVDALYAAAGAAGGTPLIRIRPLALVLALTGAAVLIFLGMRSLVSALHLRDGTDGAVEVGTPRRAFLTAVVATASNPSTIASWAAIFGAASLAADASAVTLVAGVAVGSATWVTVLACIVAVLRRHATARAIRMVDVVAGSGLVGFGGVLAYRAVVITGGG